MKKKVAILMSVLAAVALLFVAGCSDGSDADIEQGADDSEVGSGTESGDSSSGGESEGNDTKEEVEVFVFPDDLVGTIWRWSANYSDYKDTPNSERYGCTTAYLTFGETNVDVKGDFAIGTTGYGNFPSSQELTYTVEDREDYQITIYKSSEIWGKVVMMRLRYGNTGTRDYLRVYGGVSEGDPIVFSYGEIEMSLFPTTGHTSGMYVQQDSYFYKQ